MTLRACVVICTWNRVTLLRRTLAALTTQIPTPNLEWEVLVVDNASSDGTAAEVQTWRGRLPIRVVVETRLGLSHARNRGLREAGGQLIAFLDDDAPPAETWLDALAGAAAGQPEAGVFGGPVRPWFETPPDPDLATAFPLLSKGFSGVERPGLPDGFLQADERIVGANMAFRRTAVEGLHFDPELGRVGGKLSGDEDFRFIDLVQARGWKRYWADRMGVEHFLPASRMTLAYLRRYAIDTAEQCAQPFVDEQSASVMGVPRWLLARCAGQYAASVAYGAMGRRLDRLKALHEHWRLIGLIKGIRSMRQAR